MFNGIRLFSACFLVSCTLVSGPALAQDVVADAGEDVDLECSDENTPVTLDGTVRPPDSNVAVCFFNTSRERESRIVSPPGTYSAVAMKRPSWLIALSIEFSEVNTVPVRSSF